MFILKNVAFLDCLSLGCLALQDALLSLKARSKPLTDTWTLAHRVYHVSGSMEARDLLTDLEKGKTKRARVEKRANNAGSVDEKEKGSSVRDDGKGQRESEGCYLSGGWFLV